MTDEKIVDKIRKLLAKAGDSAVTEAEALSLKEKADELMILYGIEQAEISLKGGEGEARGKDAAGVMGLGREEWSKDLMQAVAESYFCLSYPKQDTSGRGKTRLTGFTVYGRKSAVVSTQLMFHYLYRTVIRLSRAETGSQRFFRFGCAERIAQRIRERHARALAAQRQEAQKASQNASGASQNALVVVLGDYQQSEYDANRDFVRGVAIGTTRSEREERDRKIAANEQRFKDLAAQGIAWDIAWWMVHQGMTLEQAQKRDAEYQEEVAKEKPYKARVDHAERRRNTASYAAGSYAGENVGLDPQVGASATRKLS